MRGRGRACWGLRHNPVLVMEIGHCAYKNKISHELLPLSCNGWYVAFLGILPTDSPRLPVCTCQAQNWPAFFSFHSLHCQIHEIFLRSSDSPREISWQDVSTWCTSYQRPAYFYLPQTVHRLRSPHKKQTRLCFNHIPSQSFPASSPYSHRPVKTS